MRATTAKQGPSYQEGYNDGLFMGRQLGALEERAILVKELEKKARDAHANGYHESGEAIQEAADVVRERGKGQANDEVDCTKL